MQHSFYIGAHIEHDEDSRNEVLAAKKRLDLRWQIIRMIQWVE